MVLLKRQLALPFFHLLGSATLVLIYFVHASLGLAQDAETPAPAGERSAETPAATSGTVQSAVTAEAATQRTTPAAAGASDPAAASATDPVAAATAQPGVERVPAKPIEQELETTPEGKIRFSFQGQRWIDVLQWLATSSKLTLDWQELPETDLNLTTQKSYTLDEARDLLNMHLATRGFTLLRRGEVLTLVKLEKLNPILVPRVDEDELEARDLHEVVRVSLPLDWLVADEAVKEFTPMLSPFGKLVPMKATNRLEAMDTVANLRGLRSILQREQSEQGEERLVMEFKLEYAQAEDIVEKLRAILGVENTGRMGTSDRMRMSLEKTKATAELAKNLGKDAQSIMRRDPDVHLVVNESENSILANAPPDKIAIIRQAIEALDVPTSKRPGNDALTRMKIYRTKAIDPDAMRELIQDLVNAGKLKSTTHVEADDDSNTLIVYATPEDHLAIANLVSQIDDDGRDVRIITLRELDADYALQAIKLLLQGGGEGESRRWWRRSGTEDFRIEADVTEGRLLLWASDEEFEQVKGLLAKLGEEPGQSTNRSAVRVLNLPARSAEQTLKSLERIWPNLRDNPLEMDDEVESTARGASDKRSAKSENREPQKENTRQSSKPLTIQGSDRTAKRTSLQFITPQLALAGATQISGEDREPARIEKNGGADAEKPQTENGRLRQQTDKVKRPEASGEVPPITITEGPNGQLIISSEDAEALDAMEGLIRQVIPERADYEVFKLKHAAPLSLELTLNEIFKVDEKTTATSQSRLRSTTPVPQLKFISDLETGTLLVQNATEEQLAKIAELIELYDQPETLDDELQRRTEIYHVKYSRASVVAETIKEVYRDLLSADDKAFQQSRKEGDAPSRSVGFGGNYTSTIPKFKGLLSVAVEDNTNTIVISAPTYLLSDVMKLVRSVDETAAGYGVQVLKTEGVSAQQLRSVLSQMPGATTSSSSSALQSATNAAAPQSSTTSSESNRSGSSGSGVRSEERSRRSDRR